jgi:hypothetical protein
MLIRTSPIAAINVSTRSSIEEPLVAFILNESTYFVQFASDTPTIRHIRCGRASRHCFLYLAQLLEVLCPGQYLRLTQPRSSLETSFAVTCPGQGLWTGGGEFTENETLQADPLLLLAYNQPRYKHRKQPVVKYR